MTSEKERPDSDEPTEEPKGGRPGPVDEGGTGGMATREVAPEIVHKKGRKD
ncbi:MULTISPECIES: hypothetical protein [Mycobacteriales]|jgi:hypothetical protein|uniref:Uncharacterized protein n=1 Tax=Gordonia rubripertincta TaxID=36822 RepID=A0ABT4N5D7_GORRU|nr:MULTISPECIES: hypothetical protein [Mycobacteriales]MCZ4553576.1 hypothetical protein [Gordonia rubripertincta]